MFRSENVQVILQDQGGAVRQSCSFDESCTAALLFRACAVPGVKACYVSAVCAAGFDGQCAIVIRPAPDEAKMQYMAIYNHSAFWCRPVFAEEASALPQERIQALLCHDGDMWHYYLPLCADVYKTLIRGNGAGFEFYMYANFDGLQVCENQPAFVYATGKHPLEMIKNCAKAAAELLGNGVALRAEKQMPAIFEYLGWCSWDTLQIRVNHQGLLDKAREFKEKHVPVRFAIIDDMWADVPALNDVPQDIAFGDMVKIMHASKMRAFAGDPQRFPHGMRAAIEDVKKEGIREVGVWFPTTGYWAGFEPNGSEAEAQSDNTITTALGRVIVAPEREKAARLFDDLCARVKSWGGDFVKVDNQGFHQKNYQNIAPIGVSARAIQQGIDQAAAKHFDGALINCMGMPSECMFNRVSTVSRCSDDFMPESREWFAKNILQCAYNGLLQGQYYVNDWDMWWTNDAQATKNSLCRAISGGPIYISDKIGCTDPTILKPLCLQDGRILRCDESATPTEDCLLGDPTRSGRIFKIRNRIGAGGVVAVFNVDAESRAVKGTLAPTESGVAAGNYVYYEYFSGAYGVLHAGERLDITLADNDEFRLYTFVPCHESGITVLGRLDLFMGIGAVTARDGNRVVLAEPGKLGLVICPKTGVPVLKTVDATEKEYVLSSADVL